MKKALIVIGIVIVVAGFGGYLFWQDLQSGALSDEGTGLPAVGEEFADEGQTHVVVGTPVEYKTNPPTSGSHYAEPANWGVYQIAPDDRQLVHNLEHGGIWISYKPSIDADTKAKLEDIGRRNPGSVVVSPREGNDANIAVVSWRRKITMDAFDRDRIEQFISHNINKAPEPLARKM